jgi:hypothetical protein
VEFVSASLVAATRGPWCERERDEVETNHGHAAKVPSLYFDFVSKPLNAQEPGTFAVA